MKYKKLWLPKNHKGYENLSQSAMNMFLKCPRAFYFDYVAHLEKDEDNSFFDRGSLFHELIEGKEETKLKDKVETIKVHAMAKKYKKLEDEGKILKPTHKEQMILNEEHQFVGYADDFLIDEQKGNWCLGENKTVAQTSIFGLHKVMNSFQTALYLEMCGPFLSKFYMSKKDVRCVEVREILVPSIKPLKGRGKNAIPEDDTQFFDRCFEKIQINAMQGLPTEETRKRALITFQKVKEAIDFNRDNEERYHCNHDMCFGFWGRKPCPFVLHCHPHLEVKFTEDDDDIDFDF